MYEFDGYAVGGPKDGQRLKSHAPFYYVPVEPLEWAAPSRSAPVQETVDFVTYLFDKHDDTWRLAK